MSRDELVPLIGHVVHVAVDGWHGRSQHRVTLVRVGNVFASVQVVDGFRVGRAHHEPGDIVTRVPLTAIRKIPCP